MSETGESETTMLQTNMQAVELSVVMPCYNEQPHIQATLREWLQQLEAHVGDYELLVINDGSDDGTGKALDGLRKEFPRLRLVHQNHRGQARAIRRGYELARGRFIFQVDSNGCYDINDFLAIWSERECYPFVFGYRTHRIDGFGPRLAHKALKFTCEYLFEHSLKDPNVSFRLFPRRDAHLILKAIPENSDSINTVLAVLLKQEFPKEFLEIPIPHRISPNPQKNWPNLTKKGFKYLIELLQVRYSPSQGKKDGVMKPSYS